MGQDWSLDIDRSKSTCGKGFGDQHASLELLKFYVSPPISLPISLLPLTYRTFTYFLCR